MTRPTDAVWLERTQSKSQPTPAERIARTEQVVYDWNGCPRGHALMLAYATLLQLQAGFDDLLAIVADWLSNRTGQAWDAQGVLGAELWQYPRIEVRTAQTREPDATVWGLQVNSRDPRIALRDWRLELTLRDLGQGGAKATVAVHALDAERPGRAASVPFSQPALVRALLERGDPAPDNPGLQTFAIDTEADAQSLIKRIAAPDRAHSVVALCRGEVSLDVPALRAALIGMADVVELRPVLPQEVGAVLKPAFALPPPARAIHFPPRAVALPARAMVPSREQRLMLALEARAMADSVLTFGAPRVLAEHLTLERMKHRNGEGPSNEEAPE